MGGGADPERPKAAPTTRPPVIRPAGWSFRGPRIDQCYTRVSDFKAADPTLKRIVILGSSGSGKSSMLNAMAGWRLVQEMKSPDLRCRWAAPRCKPVNQPMPFKAACSVRSVTAETGLAYAHFRSDTVDGTMLFVDTPGYDDTSATDGDIYNIERSSTSEGIAASNLRDELRAIHKDKLDKLKALGHIHTIVLVHKDIASNRVDPVFIWQLKMLDETFGEDVWKHVVVAYSHCNPYETTWRSGIPARKVALREAIQRVTRCTIDVPVLTLGASEPDDQPSHETIHKLDEQYYALRREITRISREYGPLSTAQLAEQEGEWVRIDETIFKTEQANGHIMIKTAKLAAMGVGTAALIVGANMALPTLLLADEIVIIGGAYFVKARSVGGRRELHRQVNEQLRHWGEVYRGGRAREVTKGVVMMAAESAASRVLRPRTSFGRARENAD